MVEYVKLGVVLYLTRNQILHLSSKLLCIYICFWIPLSNSKYVINVFCHTTVSCKDVLSHQFINFSYSFSIYRVRTSPSSLSTIICKIHCS